MSGGARVESFFIEHGLGNAYNKPSKGYGIRKRINEALLEAERQRRFDQVVAAARHRFPETTEEEPVPSTSAGDTVGRLFISHASADKELANRLVRLLRLGCDLNRSQVLCTSLDGMSIPEGTPNYIEFLRQELSGAKLVLPLITPAFFDSRMCLVELGALWGFQLNNFPIIVPPVTYQDVTSVLGSVQCGNITKSATLANLRDRIVTIFQLDSNTAMWEENRDEFMAVLPDLVGNLSSAKTVQAAEHEAVLQQLANRDQDVARLTAERVGLQDQLEQVSALKDSYETAEILEPKDETKRLEFWTEKAVDAISPLPLAVRNALYEEYGRDDAYWPQEYDFADADEALRDSYLKKHDDDSPYQLNTENPDVSDALNALADLFERDWRKPVEERFKREYRTGFDKANRQAWKALGLL